MSAQRPWVWPLVPVYAAAQALQNALRPRPQILQRPVVSVGSISAGGAGKTPVVLALAELLTQHHLSFDILSRGYGRQSKAVLRVEPEAPGAARRFGDEPTLLARLTQAPVWVGASRFAAGQAAEQAAAQYGLPALHLLDDGFQHRRLARALDLVLLTREDLDDALLPAGNRREPLTALRRASALLLRQDERDEVIPCLKELLPAPPPLWILRRQLHFDTQLSILGAGLRPLAFCAIARPTDFSASVQAAGCGLVDTLYFPDHHTYTPADIQTILDTARRLNASGFVTTEKDAVKLPPALREPLEAFGPLLVPALRVGFGDPQQVLDTLRALLQESHA
ncbi:MAG: tetraacyldisaccharide 4'-kinase [Acidobacteriaceae bacterium]|nr:tetraacyldisaccharide 4'-kinase [Acidobacteriaceae bacterium]